jgi:hypothetical protein
VAAFVKACVLPPSLDRPAANHSREPQMPENLP